MHLLAGAVRLDQAALMEVDEGAEEEGEGQGQEEGPSGSKEGGSDEGECNCLYDIRIIELPVQYSVFIAWE